MIKKVLLFALATVALAAAHATDSKLYEVSTVDKDLRALVEHWAQIEGKKLVWEAPGNAALQDGAALNSEFSLHKASSFSQALLNLNKALSNGNLDNPAKPVPLKACFFSDAIVIRLIEQPPCGSPL